MSTSGSKTSSEAKNTLTDTINAIEEHEPGKFGPCGGYSRALAVINMTWMAGLMTGPVLGGFLVETFGFFVLHCCLGKSLNEYTRQFSDRTRGRQLYSRMCRSTFPPLCSVCIYWEVIYDYGFSTSNTKVMFKIAPEIVSFYVTYLICFPQSIAICNYSSS